MLRRSFLKLGAMAAAGAAVATVLPKSPIRDVPAPVDTNAYNTIPRGTPYFIDDAGSYFGQQRFIVDPDCPPDTIYFVDLSKIQRDGDVFIIAPERTKSVGMVTKVRNLSSRSLNF